MPTYYTLKLIVNFSLKVEPSRLNKNSHFVDNPELSMLYF